jgi:predicted hydrocarbon binding protein
MSEPNDLERFYGGDRPDFERVWLARFRKALDRLAGEEVRREVMAPDAPQASDTISWTAGALARLALSVEEPTSQKVLSACACKFPRPRLQPIREVYAASQDLAQAHARLEELFVSDLRNVMKLPEERIKNLLGRGWGMAGRFQGETVVAVKMPFDLEGYFEAENQTERRYAYCHCPRVREAVRSPEPAVPRLYCYCGAGFYQDIWETILGRPVEVEVLETVLEGGEVCRIAVRAA